MSAPIITLIGGPTALIEAGGFRLLTDPTFDPPREYKLPHVTLKKTSGPALTVAQIGPLDAVLLSHDQHADNFDDAGKALRMLFLMLRSFPFIARGGRISRKTKRTLSNPSRHLVSGGDCGSSNMAFQQSLNRTCRDGQMQREKTPVVKSAKDDETVVFSQGGVGQGDGRSPHAGSTSTNTVRLHRVLAAKPDKVYRAFTSADAMARWLPPNGFTCTVHQMDCKVGGTYRMSFTNFTTGRTHAFGGKYLDLVPDELIRYTDRFEDRTCPAR
jgi:Activator of Hsp90 ATPase homolog 1-like protein